MMNAQDGEVNKNFGGERIKNWQGNINMIHVISHKHKNQFNGTYEPLNNNRKCRNWIAITRNSKN